MCLATHNSSKKRKKRKANGGKPGRKKGHEGVTREMPEPNHPIPIALPREYLEGTFYRKLR